MQCGEIESILGSRGDSYLVKLKDSHGFTTYAWQQVGNMAQNAEKLERFNQNNRRAKLLCSDEPAPAPQRRRRLSKSQKRRHNSASSADATPEYCDREPQPKSILKPPPAKRVKQPRNEKPTPLTKLHVQFDQARKHHLAELGQGTSAKPAPKKHVVWQQEAPAKQPHSNPAAGPKSQQRTPAKVIAPTISQQRPGPSQSSGDGPTTISKSVQPSLSQLLSQVPLKRDSLAQAIFQSQVDLECAKPAGNLNGPAPTLEALKSLIVTPSLGGVRGDPASLASALRGTPSCLLNEPVPGSGRERRLLHLAACVGRNSASLLLHLLVAGADVDCVDSEGVTPLLLAADKGDAAAVERLLQFRARPDRRDLAGHSAVQSAATKSHWEVVSALLRHGAEFDELLNQDWFDSDQLAPWTARLAEPLLAALRRLLGDRRPANMSVALPSQVCTLSPGLLHAFTVPGGTETAAAGRSAHLLVASAAEFDGLGGVRLRRLPGCEAPLSRLTLNNRSVGPLVSARGVSVFPLDVADSLLTTFRIGLSADCPPGTHCKLLLLVVRLSKEPGAG